MRSRNSSELIRDKLHDLVTPFLSDHLLTHVYISWGSLVKKEKVQEFLNQSTPENDLSIFDLASLTKVLVTVPLALNFLKETHNGLESPLQSLMGDNVSLPSAIAQISLLSIFKHQSSLQPWFNFWINRLSPDFPIFQVGRNERLKWLLKKLPHLLAEQNESPSDGKKTRYSDVGFLILGVLLESFYKKDLAELFENYCRKDLKFSKPPLFFPTGEERQFVSTAFCKIRNRLLVGEVHDENAAAMGGHCGHAGIFGSGAGVVEYLQKWYQTSVAKQLFHMNESLYPTVNKGDYLVGWQKEEFSFAKEEMVFKHLGFTGTGVWILPKRDTFVIILTNRVISSRTSSWIQPLRNEICKVLWEDALSSLEKP